MSEYFSQFPSFPFGLGLGLALCAALITLGLAKAITNRWGVFGGLTLFSCIVGAAIDILLIVTLMDPISFWWKPDVYYMANTYVAAAVISITASVIIVILLGLLFRKRS